MTHRAKLWNGQTQIYSWFDRQKRSERWVWRTRRGSLPLLSWRREVALLSYRILTLELGGLKHAEHVEGPTWMTCCVFSHYKIEGHKSVSTEDLDIRRKRLFCEAQNRAATLPAMWSPAPTSKFKLIRTCDLMAPVTAELAFSCIPCPGVMNRVA